MQYPILLLSGSFHSNSVSLGILRDVKKLLAQKSCNSELVNIEQLPFYSEDLEKEKPEEVQQFLEKVVDCKGIIICTPEYNHSIPAVLKNALDWASRPAFNSPLVDKPIAIISQANSDVGGARAQAHLKLILDAVLSHVHMKHEMLIGSVHRKVNEKKRLSDAETLERLDRYLKSFLSELSK